MPGETQNLLHYINICILVPVTLLSRVLLVIIFLVLFRRWQVAGRKKSRVTVIVLGDVGRSPRMQYHALSLSGHEFNVDIVGHSDSKPIEKILQSKNITLHDLAKEKVSQHLPQPFAYLVKVILQTLIISAKLLFLVPASEYILMQNPPCIPVMFICWVFSILNGSKLVIDWHNYGFTILGINLGKNHKLVRFAHWYEKVFGQLAYSEICVTEAMQKDLEEKWHIHAVVLYDRPPEHFKPINHEMQHNFFERLKEQYEEFGDPNDEDSTFGTTVKNGEIVRKSIRPAFIVSSTSWTKDEDFSILLEALQMYDSTISKSPENVYLPDIVCAITGKGPMKDYYLNKISEIKWNHVKIVTPWLSAEDYPLIVGSADLGICLHTSSSGLDLPMKVVDMFGCGVPVAAVGFKCLHELVKEDINGKVFKDANGLHNILCYLLAGFPRDQKVLSGMRKNLEIFRKSTWSKNWDEHVLPIFKS